MGYCHSVITLGLPEIPLAFQRNFSPFIYARSIHLDSHCPWITWYHFTTAFLKFHFWMNLLFPAESPPVTWTTTHSVVLHSEVRSQSLLILVANLLEVEKARNLQNYIIWAQMVTGLNVVIWLSTTTWHNELGVRFLGLCQDPQPLKLWVQLPLSSCLLY